MKRIFYLHYTGANALTEAQSACDEFHALASRSFDEGGIKDYKADKWADPIPHPDGQQYIVPIDPNAINIPANFQVEIDNGAKLTPTEAREAGWFPSEADPPDDV